MRIQKAGITLREATQADAEFIYGLIESTMRGYVEQIWGAFDEQYNRKNVAAYLDAKSYSIIECDSRDIGAIAVERQATHIQLTQIYISPAYQNRGIGTSLIRALAAEARATQVPLCLRVLSTNPAQRLYEREGFTVVSATPERVFMEWHA